MDAHSLVQNPSLRRVGILAILLVAFALRCGGLDAQELRGDEAFGYFFSLPPVGEIVEQTLDLREPHPVASYWIAHYWLQIAGHSEFALRFVGVWWSVLAVALMLPLSSQVKLPAHVANVGAALMALSPYVIWHAQDARMYSMTLCLTMASTMLGLQWWQSVAGRGRIGAAVGYLLITWLALHTHYSALYVVVAQNLAFAGCAIVAQAWRKLAVWWGIGVLLLLLWLPWLWNAWPILLDYRGNGDSPSLLGAIIRAHSAFVVGETVPIDAQLWWAILALVAIGLGMIMLWQRTMPAARSTLWFLALYWLTPLAATWASSLSRPIFNERYLVAMVPPVYMLMAAAVSGHGVPSARGWMVWPGRILVVAILLGMALGHSRQLSDPQYSKTRGWRELAAALDTISAGIDAGRVRLVQNYPDPTLWYYYQGTVAHIVLPPAAGDRDGSRAEVDALVADGVARVVLVEQPAASWDASGIARDALGRGFTEVTSAMVAQWPISIWSRPPGELGPIFVEYERDLQLVGKLIVAESVPPGGMVEVHLRWQIARPSDGDLGAVSIQLLNSAGELVAQTDQALEMASDATMTISSYGILMPATVDAGEYQIIVVAYDPSQPGMPRWLTVEGHDSHRLGSIFVVE